MGGEYGEVRGKTKIECYLAYIEHCEGWAGNDDFNDFSQSPDVRHKKVCYKEMEWDPEEKEWVLHFHLHT